MNLFCLNHIFIALKTYKMLKLIIAELINLNTLLFPYSIIEWNKLDINLHNAKSFLIIEIGRPMQNSIYNILDPVAIKYLTRLRLGLSHLNEYKSLDTTFRVA